MKLEDASKIWGEEWTHDIQLIDETITYLDLSKDSKILDIGTGFGVMAISLALAGYNVLTGEPEDKDEWLEYHEEHDWGSYIDWRESAKSFGVAHKIKYQHFNADHLPFSPDSFDAVFLYDALQHMKNRQQALKECIRVTKSNGIVCVIEVNDYGNEYYIKNEGWDIEKVDPRDILKGSDIAIEVIPGKFSNAYILKKVVDFAC